MKTLGKVLLAAAVWAGGAAHGATVKDREGAVRGDKAAMENDARWIYNDVERGFAEAKKTGKPLLVVLRCVPCLSCVGLDAEVLKEPALTPLLDQFVCVRLINANAIDLARFTLKNGTVVEVVRDFDTGPSEPKRAQGRFLRKISRRGNDEDVFSHVLTSFFNPAHKDHFHLDLARYRQDGTR
jgi:hypothetical protein